jgi:RND family efflux transporter MFP subunit
MIPLFILLALALIGGAGYLGFHSARPQRAQTVQAPPTLPVTRGDVEQTVTGPGTLVAMQDLMLEVQVSGRLAEVNVRPGDSVKTGQVLARLETLTFENAVRDATAQLEQSRLRLQKAQSAAKSGADLAAAHQAVNAAWLGVINAQGNFSSTLLRADVTSEVQMAKFWADYWANDLGDKWLQLKENPNSDSRRIQYEEAGGRAADANANMLRIQQDAQNNVSAAQRGLASARQAYLAAVAAYDSLKSGDPVKDAELEVMLNETKLTRAQMELDATTLRAPFDGVVLEVNAKAGESVGAGAGLIHLSDPTALEVKATIVEEDYPLAQVGQSADLFFDARPEISATGHITRIVPLREAGATPIYPIYIALDELPPGLAAGMTVDASVIIARQSNVLRLPRALVHARSDSMGQVKVWTGDHTEDRTVKVGLRGDQYVEIVDGLREGEQVVSK